MKTGRLKPFFNKLLKIFCVVLIIYLILVSFYSCDQITAGRSVLHEELIFNDYASKDERIQIDIINEDTLIYKHTDLFDKQNTTIYQLNYTFNDGVLFVNSGQMTDQNEEEIYKLLLLDNDRILFLKFNKILYLDD